MARKRDGAGRGGKTGSGRKTPPRPPRKPAGERKPARATDQPDPPDDVPTPAGALPPWRANEGKFDHPSSGVPRAPARSGRRKAAAVPAPPAGGVVDFFSIPGAPKRPRSKKAEAAAVPELKLDRRAIIERLVSDGVDRGRATQYADLFLEYAQATVDITVRGIILKGVMENPWVARRDKVRKALLDFRNVDAAWLWDMLEPPAETA